MFETCAVFHFHVDLCMIHKRLQNFLDLSSPPYWLIRKGKIRHSDNTVFYVTCSEEFHEKLLTVKCSERRSISYKYYKLPRRIMLITVSANKCGPNCHTVSFLDEETYNFYSPKTGSKRVNEFTHRRKVQNNLNDDHLIIKHFEIRAPRNFIRERVGQI